MPDPTPVEGAERDTIAAIATPAGRGGIGVVRVSGPQARGCISALLGDQAHALRPQRPRLCTLKDGPNGATLDEALVTWFAAPRSYTGEDVVELSTHGSPLVLDRVLRRLLDAGARLARPGEFTERAFLSGRLDLTQAEAVRDLIEAQTLDAAQLAAQQLGGAVAHAVGPAKTALVALIATLEAGIDFAEDDTPVVTNDALRTQLRAVAEPLAVLERTFSRGRLVREGATLAIVGRPNAGKSSLFNRLLERERAIVTAEPGTTRDTVQERLALDGIPLELIDTAGLREAENQAEQLGIARSREAFADAALVLLVLDATEALNEEETALLQGAAARPLVVVWNKTDLRAPDAAAEAHVQALAPRATTVRTSAIRGTGLDELRAAALQLLGGAAGTVPETAMLTNLRQHQAVVDALTALDRAGNQAELGTPHEMLLLDMYAALAALDGLTGATTPEDILGLIFSTFCIGK